MEFSPFNHVVKLCLQGIDIEEKNRPEEAGKIFLQAWNEGENDFEKFLAAYYIARNQKTVSNKLHWLETSLQCAIKVNDDSIRSAFSSLYLNIAKCYEELHDDQKVVK